MAGVVALVAAVIGAILVFSYATGADQRAMSRLSPVTVLVVQQKIPAGTPVAELGELIKAERLPAASVPSTALKNLNNSKGKITAIDLAPGEQLLAQRLIDPNELGTPGEIDVPEGFQTISFALEPQRVVGGQFTAGDTVGVFVSFDGAGEEPAMTQRLFHKVLVTRVQRADTASDAEEDSEAPTPAQDALDNALPTGTMMVTVALKDVQSAKIVFASEFGRVWLSKEPADAAEDPPTPITRSEVFP
nr:Flp pilus assembly protein CpaB [Arthrobacter roseus]